MCIKWLFLRHCIIRYDHKNDNIFTQLSFNFLVVCREGLWEMKMRKHKSTFRDVQGLCIPPTPLNGVSEREKMAFSSLSCQVVMIRQLGL